MERFLKYNPEAWFGYISLSMLYAHVGREQEARAMLDEKTKMLPASMKNVRWFMRFWPFKDLQINQPPKNRICRNLKILSKINYINQSDFMIDRHFTESFEQLIPWQKQAGSKGIRKLLRFCFG